MRRNATNVMLGLFVVVVFSMAGCGGGGGSGTSGQTASTFTAADFAGKSVYYVDGSQYIPATFSTGGAVTTSGQTGTWSIDNNGVLTLSSQGTWVRYSLISNDAGSRYFKVGKTASDGSSNIIGMFYDQATGLSQAQTFVATHRLPGGGVCDGVDTSKTPDYISLGMDGGKVVTTSTWGACVYSTDKNGVTTHN